ncbi:MlaD family protein [Daejeonella sp.]|uniref:MlaD family protein n=1 Tax=Daejeonella sp. TaxID=2805397 RepID=UPI003983B247
MAKQVVSNVKLGAFVLGGLLFLILLLYMIGKNRSLFGSTYLLKARFENVQGLIPGNNIRYSGIQTGTVKKIYILNDTIIEVAMLIDRDMQGIIRKNAVASIANDGFVGNKVINIVPGDAMADQAAEGDILFSKKAVNTDEIMRTLSTTNEDVAIIVSELKTTVQRINRSSALWEIINDQTLPRDLRTSVANLRQATGKAGLIADDLHTIIGSVKSGKGSVGALLNDTSFANNLNEAVLKLKMIGDHADKLSAEISTLVAGIQLDVNTGKGSANALLKDSVLVQKLNTSLDNIQKGTDGFHQNMEALKKSFLLRGYFKRKEKEKTKGLANPD